MLLMGGNPGQESLPLRFVSKHNVHSCQTDCHPAGFTMILCCMCSLDPWFACILFLLFCFMTLTIFCVVVLFFMPIFFFFFICLFPVFGWMHFLCVSVLSLPVQCWSLSYGKQRRPFRLCAPTWLRQQVWRTFNFFSTWTLFCYRFLSFFPLREFL